MSCTSVGMDRVPLHACSNVATTFTLEDGTVTHRRGRTWDFVTPSGSHFLTYNRGTSESSYAPGHDMGGWFANGKPGICWENTYGFLGLNVLGNNCVEGMNEAGFNGGFYTLNNTQFQTPTPDESDIALSAKDIIKYLLGTCGTVSDARDRLKGVKVWRCALEDTPAVPMPLFHISIHDAQGKHGVVEYRKGKLKFYDSTTTPPATGILTNDPIYPSQVDGLCNYSTFKPDYQTRAVVVNGVTLQSFGDIGNGSVGMPGSTSPIDRFIRLHLMLAQMYPPSDTVDATTRIWNLLGGVWAQPGSEIIPLGSYKIDAFTRWALNITMGESVSWITDRDRIPRTINLSDCDFSPDAPQVRTPLGSPDQTKYWAAEFADYIAKGLNQHSSPASSSS